MGGVCARGPVPPGDQSFHHQHLDASLFALNVWLACLRLERRPPCFVILFVPESKGNILANQYVFVPYLTGILFGATTLSVMERTGKGAPSLIRFFQVSQMWDCEAGMTAH